MDKASYRVACPQLKINRGQKFIRILGGAGRDGTTLAVLNCAHIYIGMNNRQECDLNMLSNESPNHLIVKMII